ncbi:MAG: tetratricopeptide repeat protein, partial [Candidatus Acidiferrum sp.]
MVPSRAQASKTVPATKSLRASPRNRNQANSANQAEQELQRILQAAQEAQRSGNPALVSDANRRVIALAFRELAQLRLVQLSPLPAIELYQRSLDFQDIPDTRIDLAIAQLQANHFDIALSESEKALAASPDNARAYAVKARALIGLQEFAKAAEALDHSVKAHPDFDASYLLGLCLLQTKDPNDKDRATAVFARMIRIAGDSGSLHVLFGRAYRDAGDMPAAIREFQRAIALDSGAPHAHYFLGLAKLAVNEWRPTPEVREEFSRELQKYPRDYLANYMIGFLASGDRNYAESDRYLKIAAEINPDWPEPWLYLGLNAYAQSDMARAEECFRKAIQFTGTDEARSNFQIRRAYVSLGRILANSGRTEESASYLAKARDLQNKTMEQTQQDVSEIALAGGAGSAAAIVPLNPKNELAAAPLMQENADPFSRLDAAVLARANLNEQQRAQADAQETRLRAVLGLGFNDLATSEGVSKEYLAALGHYKEAERWNAAIPGLKRNLGLAAFRANEYPEAIRALSLALNAEPDDGPVRAILGMSYFASDRYSDAIQAFTPLGDRGMQDSTVGYAWASAEAKTGDLKKAAEVLSQFERTTLSEDSQLLVGQLWIEIGDYQRAVAALRKLAEINPALPDVHYFAGQALIRSEQWPEAEKEFEAELAMVPGNSDARYNLGFVRLQQSRTDDAAKLFTEVISADP